MAPWDAVVRARGYVWPQYESMLRSISDVSCRWKWQWHYGDPDLPSQLSCRADWFQEREGSILGECGKASCRRLYWSWTLTYGWDLHCHGSGGGHSSKGTTWAKAAEHSRLGDSKQPTVAGGKVWHRCDIGVKYLNWDCPSKSWVLWSLQQDLFYPSGVPSLQCSVTETDDGKKALGWMRKALCRARSGRWGLSCLDNGGLLKALSGRLTQLCALEK